LARAIGITRGLTSDLSKKAAKGRLAEKGGQGQGAKTRRRPQEHVATAPGGIDEPIAVHMILGLVGRVPGRFNR
jgi:hypothetical protein